MGQVARLCRAQRTSGATTPRPGAVLLGKGTEVRLADAGLARFMHLDYMAAESSVGPFTWTVGLRH